MFSEATKALAKAIPGYEVRPQQEYMALAIEQAMDEERHLLVEAGTGVGKSLGYLIPAIESHRRTVVSTATKALQDQVALTDLPFLAEHLDTPFTYALLKGRSNYLCLAKIDDTDSKVDVYTRQQVALAIKEHDDDPVFMAERDDLPPVTDQVWSALTISADECPGKKNCPFGQQCFAEKARDKARASDVVVVNHSLYLTDLRVKEATNGYASMIGSHEVVVFDEAHEIEGYAGTIFGGRFTKTGVKNLIAEIRRWAYLHNRADADETVDMTTDMDSAGENLWAKLTPGTLRPNDLVGLGEYFLSFVNAVHDLREWWNDEPFRLSASIPDPALIKYRSLGRRLDGVYTRFLSVMLGDTEDGAVENVRWVEEESNLRGKQTVLRIAPVSVAPLLRDMLFSAPEGPTAILTSATMAIGGTFDYLAERLGIDSFSSLDVGTVFDYQTQARLYVPAHLADPSKERVVWQSMAAYEMGELIQASKGGALLLFTSWSAMNAAYETLAPRLPYTCLRQGDMANRNLSSLFMEDRDSVLFATRSFMTGVNFEGDSCRLVVIDKLPFPVPTEPLTEARSAQIERAGGSSFADYTVPVMTLVLKQAFGRLIRKRTDRGVVAILDPRLVTKGYGAKIVRSLPPAPLVKSLDQVQAFFDEG